MKIRKPWILQTVCLLGYWWVRALLATIFCKYWRFGPDFMPASVGLRQRYIYAMWHEYLLVPMVRFHHRHAKLLISQHADGQIVAEICKHLRMSCVRGSSTRGGVQAIKQLLRPDRCRFLGVTPDGPRGPRRQVQMGIIYLAAKLGWPIVPCGFGYRKPWRVKSWDRFAIPRPFQRAVVVTGEALVVPPDLDREGLEVYRRMLEDTMNALTERAELAALTGRKPRPLPTATMVSERPAAAA